MELSSVCGRNWGRENLQPSCVRTISEGMKIQTSNKKVVHSQKLVLELLGSDISDKTYNSDSELDFWSKNLGISESRFPSKFKINMIPPHPAISVNLDACIQCTRCVRAAEKNKLMMLLGMQIEALNPRLYLIL
ncbi:MAG: hypothetical protein CM15mP63_2960 [Gammaproteobacteria bacterium]|nr:MAG: hypothetical protein CM15mP63_2960 [Gammaproteobacteria bacterium]